MRKDRFLTGFLEGFLLQKTLSACLGTKIAGYPFPWPFPSFI
jgi:hypothetical protein